MEDLKAHTLRELLTLARERLRSAATGLKTREELLAALGEPHERPPTANAGGGLKRAHEIVTRDFFRRRSE